MNRRLLKVKRPSLLCLLLVAGITAPLSSVQSASVSIGVENAGFEDPAEPANLVDVLTNASNPSILPGWTSIHPDLDFFYGNYTPAINEEYVNPSPPVNGQIMYIDVARGGNQGVDGNGDPKKMGFEQALGETLQAGTYDLSVAVGNPRTFGSNYDGFGGYGIELIAGFTDVGGNFNRLDGATVLGSVVGDGDSIGEGLFETISLSVDILGGDALLGMALGIRLYNLNLDLVDADGNSISALSGIGFDNVQLSLSPVPVPAAIWLFGTALLGLVGFNRRRKHAA
jgi:hypothetical protein